MNALVYEERYFYVTYKLWVYPGEDFSSWYEQCGVQSTQQSFTCEAWITCSTLVMHAVFYTVNQRILYDLSGICIVTERGIPLLYPTITTFFFHQVFPSQDTVAFGSFHLLWICALAFHHYHFVWNVFVPQRICVTALCIGALGVPWVCVCLLVRWTVVWVLWHMLNSAKQ